MAREDAVLVVLGSGGHTMEMTALLRLVGGGMRYAYLAAADDESSQDSVPFPGQVHRVIRPAPPFSTAPVRAARTLMNAFQSLAAVTSIRPRALLANGPGIALFPVIFSRIIGARVVFVESISRTERLSWTGRLVRPFAHAFFVQWEPLAKRTRGARYSGRLL